MLPVFRGLGEADAQADVGDGAVGLSKQEHRALDPAPLQVAVRRLPEDGAKGAAEMRLRDVRDRSHGTDVERLGVGPVHGVASAQQAPVQVLGVPAHGVTLRHLGIAVEINDRSRPSGGGHRSPFVAPARIASSSW